MNNSIIKAQKGEGYEFLANLLSEYYVKRIHLASQAINYFGNFELVDIVQEINFYLVENAGIGAPLLTKVTVAAEWWKTNQAKDEGKRLTQIMALLKTFELLYGREANQITVITEKGILILGKRFWHKNPNLIVTGANLFPSLRLIKMNDEELEAFLATASKIEGTAFEHILDSDFSVGVCTLPSVHTLLEDTQPLLDNKMGIRGKKTYGVYGNFTDEKEAVRFKIGQALNWARKQSIKILIFPEITLDDEDCNYLKTAIQQEPGSLQLVVAGSFHRTIGQGTDFCNAAPIWVVNQSIDGQPTEIIDLGYYKKIIPFSSGNKMQIKTEDFRSGNCRRFIPVNGGIFGIAICRDVLDLLQFANPLHHYADLVDFMLMPSMNGGHTDLFTSGAESLARWHNCATFYVNAYQAIPTDSERAALACKFVELSSAFAPLVSRPNAIYGGLYYKPNPILRVDAVNDTTLGSVRSKFIKAYNLPKNGNVQYDIRIEKRELTFPDNEERKATFPMRSDLEEGLNHLFIKRK